MNQGPDGSEEARLRAMLGEAAAAVAAGDALSAVHAVRRHARWRRNRRTAGATVLTVAAATVVAVSVHGSAVGTRVPTAVPYRLTGALTSFDGCTDYLAYVKRQAEALVGPYGLRTPYQPQALADSEALGPVHEAGGPVATAATAAGVAHSGTTDQVPGVDEPDTVKADGHVVVTLTGPTLRVLDSHAHVLGHVSLPGDTGGGLLLAGDRAVVLSSTPVAATSGAGNLGPAYATPGPANDVGPGQAAVVDLSDPTAPRLLRTLSFSGSVVAARLIDGRVRLVLRSDGPRLTFQTASGPGDEDAATAANRALLASSTLADWLPSWQSQAPDGSTTPRQQLSSCVTVARPAQATGISTVSVVSLDPQGTAPGPATSVVAAGDTVYATGGHVYLAGQVASPAGAVTTHLYDFGATGTDVPRFLGAGTVPGSILGSYALDEQAGYLRVATTTQSASGATDSRITVLALAGRSLAAVGSVTGLGHGQQLRALRFVGDQAYVVTFRSFDPLYVVSLHDPRDPTVTGRLEQPGFSEFLYPLPGRRLLGVGVVLHANEPSGLVVATYDVADPARPRRISALPLADGYVDSNGYDPHAFLYWQPTALAVAAVPDTGNAAGAVAYRVSAAGVLTRVGALAHGGLTPSRTVVVGNTVWALTSAGVIVADLATVRATSWHPYS